MLLEFSRTRPVPSATQDKGSSAIDTGKPVSSRKTWSKLANSDPPPVSTMLNQDNVVPMVADWTRPDPAISRFLAQHGRYGIPLNVVYGPKAPQGIVLPEVCTVETIVQAVRQASGS